MAVSFKTPPNKEKEGGGGSEEFVEGAAVKEDPQTVQIKGFSAQDSWQSGHQLLLPAVEVVVVESGMIVMVAVVVDGSRMEEEWMLEE